MPTIDVDGTTVAYTDTGSPHDRPDAPTIVFGHGLLFSGWMFGPQVAALQDRYRCVTIDWRGQGDSRAPAPSYDMDALYVDAVTLIEKLAVGPVHWVGLSMGGFVGMRVAARRGELLRSLTLLDTTAGPEDPSKITQYKLLARVYQLLGMKLVFGKVSKLMFGPTFLADPAGKPVLDEMVSRLNASSRAGVRQAVLGVTGRLPIEPELGAITVPTLVATGTDDIPTPPAKAEKLVSAISGARLELIPECGHTSTLEQPAKVTALLEEFLVTVS